MRDDAVERYRRTIRYFLWGVVAIILGVVVSIVVDAHLSGAGRKPAR